MSKTKPAHVWVRRNQRCPNRRMVYKADTKIAEIIDCRGRKVPGKWKVQWPSTRCSWYATFAQARENAMKGEGPANKGIVRSTKPRLKPKDGNIYVLRIGAIEMQAVCLEQVSLLYLNVREWWMPRFFGRVPCGEVFLFNEPGAIVKRDGSVWSLDRPRRLMEPAAMDLFYGPNKATT